MTGIGAWIIVGVVIALFAILTVFVRNRRVKRQVICPRTGERVDVELLTTASAGGEGKPFRVESCSGLDDPAKVDCGEDCLKDLGPWRSTRKAAAGKE